MGVYFYDIKLAVVFFPLVAILITFPFLLVHYHRFGAISRWSILMLYSFVFYMMCAYFLIVFPLPSVAAVAKLTTPEYNLRPLLFIHEFMAYNPFRLSDPATWLAAIKAPTLIQPLFNIFLTVPFGVFLRVYFRRPWWQVVLLSFTLSLFFELTQLSGLYGIYPRPYRLFDVDDLLLNTTGGWLGFGLGRLVLPLLPSSAHTMAKLQRRSHVVSSFRHATAAVVDWIFVLVATILLQLALGVMHVELGNLSPVLWPVAVGLVILLPELIWHQTIGQRAVHIKLVASNPQERLAAKNVALRTLIGFSLVGVWTIVEVVLAELKLPLVLSDRVAFGLLAYTGLNFLVMGLDVLVDIFRPSHDLFFERWSGTRLVSTY
ncbi:teicoplanin resistance protein VanZ [Secundilactobacillus kimchicus]|uniref:VanZ family protein n=1 Tax=Secundilactobacillus kimchicus TaxID=528209 RepID=UPI001C010932|nr:teicoplanin resistance protein VanZ [Secundilactobacillus kimchicus]